MTGRPGPPAPPRAGLEWAAVPAPGWRVDDGDLRHLCRKIGKGYKRCRMFAVAGVTRKGPTPEGTVWWYCAEHAARYGKWLGDGQVMHWALRRKAG